MRYFHFIAIIFIICVLSGCRKELCYNHPHDGSVTVSVDWKNLPNDVKKPGGVRVVFIKQPQQTHSQTFNFPSEGGSRDISQGDYKILVVNNDPDMVLYRGMNVWETAEAFTPAKRQSPYKAAPSNVVNSSPAKARVGISAPDLLMCSNDQRVFIKEDTQDKHFLVATPDCYVKTVTVDIPVSGIKNVSEARGFLTGVSPSVFLGDGKISQVDATTLIEYGSAEGGTKLRAQFKVFGMVDRNDGSYTLGLELLLLDQSVLYYDFNVSNQITDELKIAGGKIVLQEAIIIPDVEPSGPGGGGFKPGIGGWDDEEIEIKI